MKKLVNDILNKTKALGVTFADVRYTSSDQETIFFEKGNLKHYGKSLDDEAIGVRV